ncbi:Glutamyl-tRNA reductase [Hirschfeldia incana]|nr:Glutamyl-tRNA reductase [Hirschfeldia incana]
MKSLSLSLIRRLQFHKFKPIPPLLRLNHISDAVSSPSPLLSSTREISTHSKTTYPPIFNNNNHFLANPCRNLNTNADEPPEEEATIDQEKIDLEEAFESATTTEEMTRLFKQMELSFQGNELGLSALKLGLHLDREGGDPSQVLSYAEKALTSFDLTGDNNNKPTLLTAMALQLMGSANYGLKRFSDGLGYLNRANRILVNLEKDGDCNLEDVRPVLHAVQLELANVKNAMGRREEAIENLKKSVEIKEVTFEEGSKEIGAGYRGLADAYVAVLNFNEALPYALKALEIHKKELGSNSAEVANDRRVLGVIYSGLEMHDKALEQNRLARRVLKNWGMKAELVRAEIDEANMKVALGKYDEAVEVLRGVVEETDEGSEMRGMVFISMSKALVNQQKFAESKKCLEMACGILEKKEGCGGASVEVAEAYSEVAMQYESMNEFEVAISLLQKTLRMLERMPQEQHSEGSVAARIGWLLLFSGRVSEAVPYLESAAERLKESFGAKHFGVGYVYNNLGAAYLELGRPQSAAQMFAVGKDIMDVSLGPNHVDSIDACQNLSKAYAGMGNYGLAVEFQQQVIKAWDNHGDSAKEEMKEAKRLFEELRLKARGGVSTDKVLTKALPLPKK